MVALGLEADRARWQEGLVLRHRHFTRSSGGVSALALAAWTRLSAGPCSKRLRDMPSDKSFLPREAGSRVPPSPSRLGDSSVTGAARRQWRVRLVSLGQVERRLSQWPEQS